MRQGAPCLGIRGQSQLLSVPLESCVLLGRNLMLAALHLLDGHFRAHQHLAFFVVGQDNDPFDATVILAQSPATWRHCRSP